MSALCKKNSPIVRAYYLKEAFQRFWDYKSAGWSEPYLRQWLWWASHSRLAPFVSFARMIRKHLEGILLWTRLPVANGALEGMNNKVKVVSHRAYGFRTVETYITAIWRADKGIIVTTGGFTSDAKKEAVRDGVPPIELVDGEKLVTMLEDLELGPHPIKSFKVHDAFFDEFKT